MLDLDFLPTGKFPSGLEPGLDGGPGIAGRVVDVFHGFEQPVAAVHEAGPAWEGERLAFGIGRVRQQVLTLEYEGVVLLVERQPVPGEDHGGEGRHDIADPLSNGLAAVELAIGVFDVVGILCESVCPDAPVMGAPFASRI